jgi:hypothetical protein
MRLSPNLEVNPMRRRFCFALASFLAVAAIYAVSAPAAEGTKIELKFKQDDTFYVESISNTKQTMEFAGTKQDSESDSTTVTRFKVLKSDKDGTVIEQRIESIKNKTTGGAPGADKIMDALKGATFKLTLDAKGEVTKLEGYEDFIKKLSSENDATAKMIKAFMSEETLKAAASENFAFLPNKPVSKGDTWKRSQSVPLGPLGTLKGETTYTDKGPGKDGEEIALEQTLTYSPPKEDDAGLPFKITKGEMKADKASGSLVFDASKGRLVRSDMTMKMKGSLTFEVAGNATSINLEMQQTSKSKVLDKSPLD